MGSRGSGFDLVEALKGHRRRWKPSVGGIRLTSVISSDFGPAEAGGLADQAVEDKALVRLGRSTFGLALAGGGLGGRIRLGFRRRLESPTNSATAQSQDGDRNASGHDTRVCHLGPSDPRQMPYRHPAGRQTTTETCLHLGLWLFQ